MVHTKGTNNIRLPLILTKLKAPSDFRHLLQRPRLIDKLISAIDYRVMLIQAPAGFGKTSLAMQWRELLIERGYHVAWLSLDNEDNDPERCISYIVGAIHSVAECISVDTTALSGCHSHQAIKFILTELINQITTFDKKIYLVLDDWHFIDNPVIHDALNFLVESASDNFHLIICSRKQPPLPIYTLQVKHQLCVINSTDLRFDENETADFLRKVNQINLGSADIHSLWQKTEGWVASLQLILLILRTQKREDGVLNVFDNIENTHSISEYLTENVLDNLPADTLEFLLKTSILERLNGDLCNAITARTDSQNLLKQLYKQGLFVRPLDPEQHWFQYHHLFAEFLQRRLKRQMPEQLKPLHLLAAQWFANIEHTDEAVQHAIAAQEMELAISWVEKDAMWLVEHSFMGTLLRLKDKLPAKNIQTRCQLQMAIAWAYCLTHHQHEAQQALDIVKQVLADKEHANEKSIRIEMQVLQACIDMYADRLDRVEQLLPTQFDEEENLNPWVRVVANNIITYVLIHSNCYTQAIQLQQQTSRFHQHTRGTFSSVFSDCFAGIAYLEQCQFDMAEQCFKQAQQKAWEKTGKHSHAAYLSGALLGQVYYERNQIDDATPLLLDSRKLGVEGGIVDFYMATYCFGSRIAMQQRHFSEAHAILDEGQKIAQKLKLIRLEFALKAELIKLYLLDNKVKSAEQLMRQWQQQIIPVEYARLGERILDIRRCANARLLCRNGKQMQAIEQLSTMLHNHIEQQRHYAEMVTRTLLATIMNKAGRYAEAEEMLLPALQQGFAQGIIRTFIDEDEDTIKVISRLAKRCRQEPDSKSDITENSDTHDTTTYNNAEFSRWLVGLIALYKKQASDSNAPSAKDDNATTTNQNEEVLIEPFKDKEIHIIKMLEKGLTNKKIARNLNVSVDTVKWYLKAIYSKLGVSRRTQAVIEARKLRLLD
ncbi:LuxR C-terminal-related transcriptional regulator [Psychrobacter sp. I-STPA6b]|uniref:LuxR C-terminal-related transcriptional regulator n=1 Tax=Psychrobacter sp. I-STPA6b TaxID=2585718 RepID=UPI001D0C0802|nr:LuxR C-terminal-related transcriptional regulator [Psychrobacter sp. I-STPA6b]